MKRASIFLEALFFYIRTCNTHLSPFTETFYYSMSYNESKQIAKQFNLVCKCLLNKKIVFDGILQNPNGTLRY